MNKEDISDYWLDGEHIAKNIIGLIEKMKLEDKKLLLYNVIIQLKRHYLSADDIDHCDMKMNDWKKNPISK